MKNNEITKTYTTNNALVNGIEFYNLRNKKLHFTNFGNKKTNKNGNPVMSGILCNSYDLAEYLNIDTTTLLDTIFELFEKKSLIQNNFKYYSSSVKKEGYKKLSSWKSYEEFEFNTDPDNPDLQSPIVWLTRIQAKKVIKMIGGQDNE